MEHKKRTQCGKAKGSILDSLRCLWNIWKKDIQVTVEHMDPGEMVRTREKDLGVEEVVFIVPKTMTDDETP